MLSPHIHIFFSLFFVTRLMYFWVQQVASERRMNVWMTFRMPTISGKSRSPENTRKERGTQIYTKRSSEREIDRRGAKKRRWKYTQSQQKEKPMFFIFFLYSFFLNIKLLWEMRRSVRLFLCLLVCRKERRMRRVGCVCLLAFKFNLWKLLICKWSLSRSSSMRQRRRTPY